MIGGTFVNTLSDCECIYGFYQPDNGKYYINTSRPFVSYIIPVNPGETLYYNYIFNVTSIVFLNNEKQPCDFIIISNTTKFSIPNKNDIKYVSVPINYKRFKNSILSKEKLPDIADIFGQINDTTNQHFIYSFNKTNASLLNYFNKIADANSESKMTVYDMKNAVGIGHDVITDISHWILYSFNTQECSFYLLGFGFISIAHNDDYAYGIQLANTRDKSYLFKMSLKSNGDYTEITDYDLPKLTRNELVNKLITISIYNGILKIKTDVDGVIFNQDLSGIIPYNYILSIGHIIMGNQSFYNTEQTANHPQIVFPANCNIKFDDDEVFKKPQPITVDNHWSGKTWYAYGTSITNTNNEGTYAKYLAKISGMNHVNKGISGGGICKNTAVKQAVMNTTDGKLNADLITLETRANDGSSTLGNITDTDGSTFCGALHQCIQYLQENTNAQIVVMSSPVMIETSPKSNTFTDPYYRNGADNHLVFDFCKAIREVCELHGVYYIPLAEYSGMGYYRQRSHMQYTQDGVHPSELGGYNIAQFIWSKLKDLPLWYNEIPQ